MEPDILELETYRPTKGTRIFSTASMMICLAGFIYAVGWSPFARSGVLFTAFIGIITLAGVSVAVYHNLITERIEVAGRNAILSRQFGPHVSLKEFALAGAAKATVGSIPVFGAEVARATGVLLPTVSGGSLYLCRAGSWKDKAALAAQLNEYFDRTRPA